MKLLDANPLIYAGNGDSPQHAKARSWLEKSLTDTEPVGFSWLVILAFVRLTTRPGIFQKHLRPAQAFDLVAEWLDQPAARVFDAGPRRFSILRGLLAPLGTAGNLAADAHPAALAIEQNAQLCSCDNDFNRFPGLRWKNPLAGC
jgi:toxin-antitoxin system PIN domain toxin